MTPKGGKYADILRGNLERIDSDSDGAVVPELTQLHRKAHYDGSRFNPPNFGEASRVLLSVIDRKRREFIEEIRRVLGTRGVYLGPAEASQISALIDRLLAEELYVGRLRSFAEGVARTAASYGVQFDPDYINVTEAAYRSGVVNTLRNARTIVLAELELQRQAGVPERVRQFSQWWRYIRSHPWKSLALLLIAVVVWAFSMIDVSRMSQWLKERPGQTDEVKL